ncbi:pyruvate carboxyltransferase [Streptomyces sp. A1277]|uniref:LeuA family protein n=1 Tax=Streptomyces sp. A1277 TaxID=2563103 RepID=UPI0010A22897|nr:LeuA family protein [Streptomyces sp. A1277]THA29975.1 pyruvate carboxyltransferase [Streptomyces sp. A1277]
MTAPTQNRRIAVVDTTLRDGEQAPGNAMQPDDKVEMARRIEELGVDVVEAAFPASSPRDFEATRLIAQELKRARLATFSRTMRSDIETAVEAAGTDNHEVQLVATGSDIHLTHKRGITRQQSIDEITDSVAFARSLGVSHVSVGIEDASRGADDLVHALCDSAVQAGADCVILADTTGCAVPEEYGALIAKVRSWVPPSVRISTHCHNDFGLSLANALAALRAGADEVQVTLGGIGERGGNTPLEELAAVLAYKTEEYGMSTGVDLSLMYDAYETLRRIIHLDEPRNKPIFGTYVFGTTAGIHQKGMLSNPTTYEFVEPSRFGRSRSLLIGRHSGRGILRHMLEQIGADVDEERFDQLYRTHISEREGVDCEDLSLVQERLARELAGHRELPAGQPATV